MGMNVTPDLAALQNRLVVNESDIATNTANIGQNTAAVTANQGDVANVDAQITNVQNLKTGVDGEISSLRASLSTEEDEAQISVIEDEIEDLNLKLAQLETQEQDLNNQKTDLVKVGEDLTKKGQDLEANGVRLDGEHTVILSQISEAEAAIKAAEEAKAAEETKAPVTETPADMQVDVPVQNNKGWQYYAELELKAQHGNDPNYKPSDSELSAKADEIKQRNIKNGNVDKDGVLRVGDSRGAKYVTLHGDIDTSDLQTSEQALRRYNQGQAKLAREAAEARARAEEERRINEARNFSMNLNNDLTNQVRNQEQVERGRAIREERERADAEAEIHNESGWRVAGRVALNVLSFFIPNSNGAPGLGDVALPAPDDYETKKLNKALEEINRMNDPNYKPSA